MVSQFLKEGVLSSGFNNKNLKIVLDEETALNEALDSSSLGDIVILFFDEYEPALKFIKKEWLKKYLQFLKKLHQT